MGDSQQPKPAVPQREVPDLELEPAPRPARAEVTAPSEPLHPQAEYDTANLFEDEPFVAGSSGIELELPDRAWPSVRAPDCGQLKLDPLEPTLLAGYGEPPKSVHRAPAYAYRVFKRRRELKNLLVPLEAERARAEAELARAVGAAESRTFRVGRASQRADALRVKCELHLRALNAYDRPKFAQGVRLACTIAAFAVLLLLLEIIL